MKKLKNFLLNFSGYFAIIFQYVPTAAYYFGIMSIPFISYLFLFFSHPQIRDLKYFVYEYVVTLLGLVFIIYCLIYLHKNKRTGLIMTGPYKYMRHPQYSVIIIVITVLTLTSYLYTDPIPFIDNVSNPKLLVWIVWGIEIIIYLFLSFIEELALQKEFPAQFQHYKTQTWRFIPKITFLKKKSK
ncbi:MAG: methyltransferase family protein [Promethearchaeota archaeon]